MLYLEINYLFKQLIKEIKYMLILKKLKLKMIMICLLMILFM
jgi:hypothetical protein